MREDLLPARNRPLEDSATAAATDAGVTTTATTRVTAAATDAGVTTTATTDVAAAAAFIAAIAAIAAIAGACLAHDAHLLSFPCDLRTLWMIVGICAGQP